MDSINFWANQFQSLQRYDILISQKILRNKVNVTFEQLVRVAFYDSPNQVNIIFSSKVIILPNNRKNYLEIQ